MDLPRSNDFFGLAGFTSVIGDADRQQLIGAMATGAHRPVPDRREHAFDGIRRPQVVPMLGGKAVERKPCVAIFRQALDRLVVLRCEFLGETY